MTAALALPAIALTYFAFARSWVRVPRYTTFAFLALMHFEDTGDEAQTGGSQITLLTIARTGALVGLVVSSERMFPSLTMNIARCVFGFMALLPMIGFQIECVLKPTEDKERAIEGLGNPDWVVDSARDLLKYEGALVEVILAKTPEERVDILARLNIYYFTKGDLEKLWDSGVEFMSPRMIMLYVFHGIVRWREPFFETLIQREEEAFRVLDPSTAERFYAFALSRRMLDILLGTIQINPKDMPKLLFKTQLLQRTEVSEEYLRDLFGRFNNLDDVDYTDLLIYFREVKIVSNARTIGESFKNRRQVAMKNADEVITLLTNRNGYIMMEVVKEWDAMPRLKRDHDPLWLSALRNFGSDMVELNDRLGFRQISQDHYERSIQRLERDYRRTILACFREADTAFGIMEPQDALEQMRRIFLEGDHAPATGELFSQLFV